MSRKLCTCGKVDVTTTDSAAYVHGWIVVHGLHHCYTMTPLAPEHEA